MRCMPGLPRCCGQQEKEFAAVALPRGLGSTGCETTSKRVESNESFTGTSRKGEEDPLPTVCDGLNCAINCNVLIVPAWMRAPFIFKRHICEAIPPGIH